VFPVPIPNFLYYIDEICRCRIDISNADGQSHQSLQTLEIVGWAFGADPILGITALIDGRAYPVHALTGGIRDDVMNAFPGERYAQRSGFRVVLSLHGTASHLVRLQFLGSSCDQHVDFTVSREQKVSPSAGPDVFDRFVEIAFHGCRLLLPERDHIAQSILAGHEYEPYVMGYLLSLVREDTAFLDVGANVGLFSIPVANLAKRGTVYAIEALARNAKIIARNAELNGLTNIEVIPIGVAEKVGANYWIRQDHSTNNQVRDVPKLLGMDFNSFELIGVAPIDSLVDESRRISLMKIDIEGREYRAFLGAKRLLTDHQPTIFCEYNPAVQRTVSGVEGGALLKLIFDAGYSFEILHRTKPREQVHGSIDQIVDRIDSEWRRHCREERGTHLDLCFVPLAPGEACHRPFAVAQ
jgi:FkbM family methyltransferase